MFALFKFSPSQIQLPPAAAVPLPPFRTAPLCCLRLVCESRPTGRAIPLRKLAFALGNGAESLPTKMLSCFECVFVAHTHTFALLLVFFDSICLGFFEVFFFHFKDLSGQRKEFLNSQCKFAHGNFFGQFHRSNLMGMAVF